MRSSEWSSEGCSSDLADIVVDGGARDDARELEVVVLVVEARQVELERAVQEGVLRTDLERVDLPGLAGDRHREYRRQRRVDAARLLAARSEDGRGGERGGSPIGDSWGPIYKKK